MKKRQYMDRMFASCPDKEALADAYHMVRDLTEEEMYSLTPELYADQARLYPECIRNELMQFYDRETPRLWDERSHAYTIDGHEFLLATQKGDEEYIEMMYCRPEYRRRGYARAMIMRLVQDARGRVSLHCKDANENAIKLYSDMGFIQDPHRRVADNRFMRLKYAMTESAIRNGMADW